MRRKPDLKLLLLTAIAFAIISGTALRADEHPPGVSASESLRMLLEGNQRFISGKMTHPDQTTARRVELVRGQHPFAAILACSDSRTAPEILFDRGLGDIFVARVAGNVADQVVIESLDYAVKHLGVRLMMILGHRRCGAVTAAVIGHDEPGDVGPMLSELRPAVEASKGEPGDPVENAIRENVKLVVTKLADSPELSAMVKSRELKVVGGIYDLDSGKIEMLP